MPSNGATADCAICYVADRGFLFASVASALTLRAQMPAGTADVLLFLEGDPDPERDRLARSLDALGIRLMPLRSDVLGVVDADEWWHGHVPKSALGRFLIADTVAQSYRRLLYVDGDTVFTESPAALLANDIPDGTIGAVEDPLSYARRDIGRIGSGLRRYFADLGIGRDQGYFNSGVFLVGSETWRDMAREALGFLLENTAICRHHDQSAMNAVLGTRRVALPIRWNFQTPYQNLRLAGDVRPAILHFTGSTKPWFGPLAPWERMLPLYLEAETRIADIAARPSWPDDRVAARNAETRWFFWKMHLLFAPRVAMKRSRILQADREAARAFEERAAMA